MTAMDRRHKKRVRRLCIISGAVLFLTVYAFMFYRVNSLYPQGKRNLYAHGETFAVQEGSAKIKSARFVEKDEIMGDEELHEQITMNLSENLDDFELLLVNTEFYNDGKESFSIDLTALHLESGSIDVQFFYPLIFYYNGGNIKLKLEPGEKTEIILPYQMGRVNFSDSGWRQLRERSFVITHSLYPEKNMAEVEIS